MEHADSNTSLGYEANDIDVKGIVIATTIILGLLVAIVFMLRPLFSINLMQHVLTTNKSTVTQNFPVPLLQPFPRVDWQDFHTWEEDQLDSYGWVDAEKRIVRVPISEAMDVFLRQEQARAKERGKHVVPAP